MKGTVQIAKIFNIPIFIHWSFAFVGLWVLYLGNQASLDIRGMLQLGFLVLSIFFCVVLHEYGHALTARRFGVKTKDIILSPIGGIARLTSLPERPIHEFWVAIAGPLVNIAIVLLLSPFFIFHDILDVFTDGLTMSDMMSDMFYFIPLLIGMNFTLAIFNLIPAFPMDGGRVFRSLLSIKIGRLKATRIATYFGQFFAFLFVIWGLWSAGFVMALIGVFIYFMASSEYHSILMESVLSNHQVKDIVRPEFTRLYTTDQMQGAVRHLHSGMEKNFLVFDEMENLVGMLSEKRIIKAMKGQCWDSPVKDYMSRRVESLQLEDSLKEVLNKMQRQQYTIMPVVEAGTLIGVVDMAMIDNFIKLQQKVVND
jgi:Zn-dependent protease/predicted transcriptional regulator